MEIKGKILLVEDDYHFGAVTKKRLEEAGFEVDHAIDGLIGWQLFLKISYDLVLLDIVLPKKSGYEVSKGMRDRNDAIPIIFITSKDADEDRIKGFKYGGDDYIIKPFSMQELLLRIEVWLKRSKPLKIDKTNIYKVGTLVFNYAERKIIDTKTQKFQDVTHRESDILKFFFSNPNKTLKREEILYNVWGKDDYFLGRSMDVFITKVRRILKGQEGISLITIHGIGFKLVLP